MENGRGYLESTSLSPNRYPCWANSLGVFWCTRYRVDPPDAAGVFHPCGVASEAPGRNQDAETMYGR